MTMAAQDITPSNDWRRCPPVPLPPILDAALGAFYDYGYTGASVREIARRVGVTVPALYYHYESKEMILFSLVDISMDHVSRLCQAASADGGTNPEERFLNMVECLVRYMAQSDRLAYLDAETRRLSPALRKVYTGKRAQVENALRTAVQDGIQASVFGISDATTVTKALLGTIQAITTWYRPNLRLAVDDIVQSYLEIALRMVGARLETIRSLPARRLQTLDGRSGKKLR
jgi:AcrR family transcriptional regulator